MSFSRCTVLSRNQEYVSQNYRQIIKNFFFLSYAWSFDVFNYKNAIASYLFGLPEVSSSFESFLFAHLILLRIYLIRYA